MASNTKSTFVSAKAMARFIKSKVKFRKDWKLIALEDHRWQLRSLDQKFMGVGMGMGPTMMRCTEIVSHGTIFSRSLILL